MLSECHFCKAALLAHRSWIPGLAILGLECWRSCAGHFQALHIPRFLQELTEACHS